MQRLAAYVLKQTKKYAGYCGGDSQIYTLKLDGAVSQMSADEILEEERIASLATETNRHLFYAKDQELTDLKVSSGRMDDAISRLQQRVKVLHAELAKEKLAQSSKPTTSSSDQT
jgi:hypothetical protein